MRRKKNEDIEQQEQTSPTPEAATAEQTPEKKQAAKKTRRPKVTESAEAATATPKEDPITRRRTKKSEEPSKDTAAEATPALAPKPSSGRKKKTEEPAAVKKSPKSRSESLQPELPAAIEADPPKVESTSKRQRRTGKPKSEEIEPTPAPAEDLTILAWRKPKEAEAEPQKESAVADETLAPRRSKNRKRKDREQPITAAAALGISKTEQEPKAKNNRSGKNRRAEKVAPEAKPLAAQEPPKPQRELISIPEDAPQIILRDGIATLVKQKQVYPPIFFFGSSLDERRASTVLDEIRLAAENDIHVHCHYVELEVDPGSVDEAVAFAGYLLKKNVEIDPSAQLIYRIVFTAPRGWETKYPKAKHITEGGGLAEPSICDDVFWGVAEECLVDFIVKLRLLDTDGHVMGVHLERGEWFFAQGWGYDTSIAAHEKFREWTRVRYRDDVVALRASWFDGQVHFQTVNVPEYKHEGRAGEEFVRTGRKTRKWVDYHLFLSDSTVERIGKLAYAAKKASQGYMLVGVSYGYTFEWSHPASGHLSLGKLLRTPEIDFIAGPPSYKNREPGRSAPFPGPIDSFALNGKLYISEEDFKTPISGRQEPDDFNPVMRTPQALESVHWRGAGAALAHQSGICWMDLWGNGWLKTTNIWQRGAKIHEALIRRMAAAPPAEPDVAVFIDERSLAYLVDQTAFSLLVQNVREAVLRSGLSVGFYLLSDLAHREAFPESKLYVFMNAWDIRPEVRSAIKSRLQRDNKVLFWLYAAGLFDGGRESLERVREVTGIALKRQPFSSKPGTTMLSRKHPLCESLPEKSISGGGQLEPSYFAIPEDGIVLGEYSQTGLPSFVVREFNTEGSPELSWKSVFLGEPIVTPGLFRVLGQMAGAHVWNFVEDVIHVRPPFLTIHCSGEGMRTITLPDKWCAYNLVTEEWTATDSTHLRFHCVDGSTHLFLVGVRAELESILAAKPSDLLTVEQIPQRPENTVHFDSLNFDVAIMKLDQWMDETWSEELAEDLLLKPSMLDVDIPESLERASSGRSRRRRRGRGNGGNGGGSAGGTEETATKRSDGETVQASNLEMNVIFRKRE